METGKSIIREKASFCAVLVLAALGCRGQEIARFEIDAAQCGNPISPQLFGHNLEHTRKAIWTGISAEMVANRKFAATDSGMPMRWFTFNGKGGQASIDEQEAYAGKYSVKLNNSKGTFSGIYQQHDWLTFGKNRKYVFRIWAKSNKDQTALLQLVTREGFTVVFSQQETIKAGEWQLWSGEFTSPVLAKGTCLQISLRTPGRMWLGAVSIMPADNFHGMRKDVVELLKQLKPGNMRWPGGCFAEYYNWKEGLLPVDKRPPIGPHQWVGLLPDSDGYDNHDIGIDEFMALCRELGCDPHITTRYGGEGTIEEAADWVEYCNGPAESRWGRIRAKRGHKEPYGIKYWYVGNELAGMSLVKDKTPEACAVASAAYARAMKKVDGGIVLNSGAPSGDEWLVPQFEHGRGVFDMLQLGFYFPPEERYIDDFDRVARAPMAEARNLLWQVRGVGDRIYGKKMGLTFYEWNVMWDREGDVSTGVFAAGMLNMFCREADKVGLVMASYFQPVTEGAILVGPLKSTLGPDGKVFAMYSAHQNNRLLDVPNAEDSRIDALASLGPDGKSIFITLVNKDVSSAHEVELSLVNFEGFHGASAELLVSQVLEVGGDFSLEEKTLPVLDGNKVRLEIPRFSVAGVRLTSR